MFYSVFQQITFSFQSFAHFFMNLFVFAVAAAALVKPFSLCLRCCSFKLESVCFKQILTATIHSVFSGMTDRFKLNSVSFFGQFWAVPCQKNCPAKPKLLQLSQMNHYILTEDEDLQITSFFVRASNCFGRSRTSYFAWLVEECGVCSVKCGVFLRVIQKLAS